MIVKSCHKNTFSRTVIFISIFILWILLIAFVLIIRNKNHGCEIDPFEVKLPPLVVISGTNVFIYPKHGEKVLKLSSGQFLDFMCPGQTVILAHSDSNSSLVNGTCVGGSTFSVSNIKVEWKDLRCSDIPWRTIRYTGNKCESHGKEIEAGFKVGDNRFLRFILICFNQKLQMAYYSYINQTASINQKVLKTPRPPFSQSFGFYDIGKIDMIYRRNNQRTTINRLLGLPDNSTKYIQNANNYFLSRGHLTARYDGFYAAQQNVTFFYQNVAPQWQTFNGFNWNQMEIDVRDYAEVKGLDLQIWTGIHGVTTLPHESTGEPVELYIFVDETSNRKALPVPELFWKVAYDPLTARGIVLIGVNNPYNSTFTTICYDVSHKLTWLRCNKKNQQQGFSYACSIDNFRKVVTTVPNILDRGLLL